MRYFLQRTSAADGTVFRVLDGLCKPLYRIKTVHPFPTCRLNLESDGKVEAKIVRVPLPSVRAHSISCAGFGFQIIINGDSCSFYGTDWRIRGSIASKNFDIIDAAGKVIAAVLSHSRVADAVELNISEDRYTVACICAAVCLNLAQTVDNLRAQPV